MRLREFTDRPEVARDLASIGEIECRKVSGKKKGTEIALYRAIHTHKG